MTRVGMRVGGGRGDESAMLLLLMSCLGKCESEC